MRRLRSEALMRVVVAVSLLIGITFYGYATARGDAICQINWLNPHQDVVAPRITAQASRILVAAEKRLSVESGDRIAYLVAFREGAMLYERKAGSDTGARYFCAKVEQEDALSNVYGNLMLNHDKLNRADIPNEIAKSIVVVESDLFDSSARPRIGLDGAKEVLVISRDRRHFYPARRIDLADRDQIEDDKTYWYDRLMSERPNEAAKLNQGKLDELAAVYFEFIKSSLLPEKWALEREATRVMFDPSLECENTVKRLQDLRVRTKDSVVFMFEEGSDVDAVADRITNEFAGTVVDVTKFRISENPSQSVLDEMDKHAGKTLFVVGHSPQEGKTLGTRTGKNDFSISLTEISKRGKKNGQNIVLLGCFTGLDPRTAVGVSGRASREATLRQLTRVLERGELSWFEAIETIADAESMKVVLGQPVAGFTGSAVELKGTTLKEKFLAVMAAEMLFLLASDDTDEPEKDSNGK